MIQVLGAVGTCSGATGFRGVSRESRSEHSWMQSVLLGVPHFRLSKGTWVPQATVWPIVKSHCVLPKPGLCLEAGEREEMLPLRGEHSSSAHIPGLR